MKSVYSFKKNYYFDKGYILWLQILNSQIPDLSYQCEELFTVIRVTEKIRLRAHDND